MGWRASNRGRLRQRARRRGLSTVSRWAKKKPFIDSARGTSAAGTRENAGGEFSQLQANKGRHALGFAALSIVPLERADRI